MPLGEIKRRKLPAREMFRLEELSRLTFPGNLAVLRHLSRADFVTWLYMLEPRVALVWATIPVFREVMEYQRGKKWYHEVRDVVWRLCYGDI